MVTIFQHPTITYEVVENILSTGNIEVSSFEKIALENASDLELQRLFKLNEDEILPELHEIYYKLAVIDYEDGNIYDATEKFNNLQGLLDVAEYLDKCNTIADFLGTWGNQFDNSKIIVFSEQWEAFGSLLNPAWTDYSFENSMVTIRNVSYYARYYIKENQLFYEYYDEDTGEWVEAVNTSGDTIAYVKLNDDITIPDIPEPKKEPSIGMTTVEAENSTWGKPNDINTTTTQYGTREQWVYSGYKYLYFEDGILTTIQD